MKRIDLRDVIGGGLLILVGAASAFTSYGYGIGTVRRMEAGYFPLVLSLLLALFGALILIPALRREGSRIIIEGRNVLFVTLAILTFAVALRYIGLLFTVPLTVLVVSMASALTFRQALIAGLVMTAAIWAVFILALGMTVPLMPFSR